MAEYLVMDLKSGPVKIRLRPDLAPNHVARVTELTEQGFYDGIVFHRVIPGFMAQTGDPTGTGSGGSDLPDLKAEFSGEKHKRGTLSMARTNAPHSATSQFFVNLKDNDFLDYRPGNHGYAVFAKVTEGMDTVDRIAAVRTGRRQGYTDAPMEDVLITSARRVTPAA